MVQVGSRLGMEALYAAMYEPDLSLSLSVMMSSQSNGIVGNDVTVALNTFRSCLLSTSDQTKFPIAGTASAPATVITPFRE